MQPPPLAGTKSSTSSHVHLPSHPAAPAPILVTESIVAQWPTTPGFKGFWGWIKQRCDRIRGREILLGPPSASYKAVPHLMNILERIEEWIEEIPLQAQSSQRFGNLAFRNFIKLVEERLPSLLNSVPLPPRLSEQILPLLLQSHAFGHPVRLDYGTGHEFAFLLALWCCVVSGFVEGEEEEDELVLRVFPRFILDHRYLEVVTALQKKFRLEPAGSHGVWGLDDFCFFPYLFGAAQLLDSPISPAQCLQNALSAPSSEPRQFKDLYTLSLYRITLFKKGAAFSEHSPLLHQLSTFPDWKKPFGGLQKMFLGEVAGKRVVVQGLWIGGWCWGENMPVVKERPGGAAESGMRTGTGEATKAPWAR
ncbi:protein phosphatase type 2A regulator [Naematelia encephala]|uniref:Serine/threonine-protein phosphatase 2A activator n=1 Tax=Naematelia encephala TaxID=71784 RepID=A0A1Y2AR87_9TREE|nr:protein phosphatase type 2A regulator [Naematelia encephala]